ncbi:MAG: SOS response-associated peptidase family protein [Rudaea sp.]
MDTRMCYSAQVQANYKKYVRVWGADISLEEFFKLYWDRTQGMKVRTPKALDDAFSEPQNDEERRIKALVGDIHVQQAHDLEQELFGQKKRLADAERSLRLKATKAATQSRRVATDKIAWALGKLSDLRRTGLKAEDSRIFPGWYAPVMVMQDGRRTVRPMRYQCRLAGKPASYDTKYPGTYNARRDNLQGFWKESYGCTHGVMIVNAFFENVSRHRAEGRELHAGGREENIVLEFRPRPEQEMLVACLWSHWREGDDELLSFAAITDEPPAEIVAVGHDRCIIPIRPENVDAWLSPQGRSLAELKAILDDRATPYFEHRLAA